LGCSPSPACQGLPRLGRSLRLAYQGLPLVGRPLPSSVCSGPTSDCPAAVLQKSAQGGVLPTFMISGGVRLVRLVVFSLSPSEKFHLFPRRPFAPTSGSDPVTLLSSSRILTQCLLLLSARLASLRGSTSLVLLLLLLTSPLFLLLLMSCRVFIVPISPACVCAILTHLWPVLSTSFSTSGNLLCPPSLGITSSAPG
jgi:hypothetical protein